MHDALPSFPSTAYLLHPQPHAKYPVLVFIIVRLHYLPPSSILPPLSRSRDNIPLFSFAWRIQASHRESHMSNNTFIGANGQTCRLTMIQTGLPIPDIPYFSAPGKIDDPAMITCCSPNPVNLVESCYLWCRLPPSYANLSSAEAGSEFNGCLNSHNRTSSASSVHIPTPRQNSAEEIKPGVWRLVFVTGIILSMFN